MKGDSFIYTILSSLSLTLFVFHFYFWSRDTLDSVEVFDLENKGQGWRVVTGGALPVPVRSMAAAVVGDNIYIFGELLLIVKFT